MKSALNGVARVVPGALVTALVAACGGGGGGGGGNPVGPTPAGALSAIALNPATVVGTNGVGVTATLNSAAPGAGARVAVSSSDGSVAPVPPEIIIAGGQTSGTVSFTTAHVTSSRDVTITASYLGVSQFATLQVTPLMNAIFSVVSPARGADACQLASGGVADCELNGSASSTSVVRWLWTLIVAGEAPRTYDRTNAVFRPATDCGLFDNVPNTNEGGLTFLQMEVRLRVFDAQGRESADTINRNVRVFPQQNCGRGF